MSVTFATLDDLKNLPNGGGTITGAVHHVSNYTFNVAENIISGGISVTLGSGWSGNIDDGFTHSAGSTEALRITTGDHTAADEKWLITFEATGVTEELLYVSFGDAPITSIYNGVSSFAVALRVNADGDDLLFTPKTNYAGTVKNITARKITDDGTESYTYPVDSVVAYESLHLGETGYWNVILGTDLTMTEAVNSTRTIAIGHNTLREIVSGNRNIGVGTFAMSQMTSGESNTAVGADTMFEVQTAKECVAIGKGALNAGAALNQCIAIGLGALKGRPTSSAFHNIGIGSNAGMLCTGDRNLFVGYNNCMDMSTGIANIYIGDQCVGASGRNQNIVIGASAKAKGEANRSIAIGYQAETSKENQCVIGGANITEVVLAGKKINFNEDGTVTWEAV